MGEESSKSRRVEEDEDLDQLVEEVQQQVAAARSGMDAYLLCKLHNVRHCNHHDCGVDLREKGQDEYVKRKSTTLVPCEAGRRWTDRS